jgi:hypothetical protein
MDTYKSTNTINGRFYIGSTTNFEARKKAHLNSDFNFPFQNALRANPEAFIWDVWTDDNENRELEQALLDMWFGTEQCYNLSPYANGGSGFVCQDYTWITNNVAEKLLPPGEDVPEGWEAGRLPVSSEARRKKSESLLNWEDNPFRKTGEESMAHGRKWVTTPERDKEKYLKPGEEAPDGWISGRMKRPPRSEESRERTRRSLKGKPKSDSHKQNLREATLNYYANKGKTP